MKWKDRHAEWLLEMDFSVRSPESPCTRFFAVCHSSVATAAALFPTGLNLSKGIPHMSEPPLINKDSLVLRAVSTAAAKLF